MESDSLKPNLLVLVSKILRIALSNDFVERLFSLKSSHWTDTRNQCTLRLIRAELQVKMNFTFDWIQVYHYIREKKSVLNASAGLEKYY